jgi:hypothetical protein
MHQLCNPTLINNLTLDLLKALPQSRYSFNVMLKVTLTLMLCYTQKLSFFFTMMLCSLDVI